MPTYEYACRSCGAQLEAVQSFTDDALTTCGTCGGPLRKVFGAVGISFKGSGFYKTDSRKGSSSKSATTSASDEGSKTTGGDTAANGTGAATKESPSSPSSSSASGGEGGSSTKAPAASPKPKPSSTT